MVATAPTAPVLLTVRQLARRPLRVVLVDRLEVGRDCDGLLLSDARSSRRHAEFVVDTSGVSVVDLGSSNGTMVNGAPITDHARLVQGDVVGIGDCQIMVGGPVGAIDFGDDSPLSENATRMDDPDRPRSSIERLSDSVTAPEFVPELASIGDEEGTFTIVFSDIEDSTVLATTLGDEAWLQALDIHNAIVRAELDRQGGTEIKSQGDGFMMSFTSARRAVMFAIAVERQIEARRESDPDWTIRVRVGVHTGEAVQRPDGDLFGRHVIIASRIANHANGGEILASSMVRDLTEGKHDLRYDDGRQTTLKGIGDQVVHRVLWDSPP